MCERDKTTGDAERSRPDEGAAFDMKRHMAAMMAQCPCGPGMMRGTVGPMGERAAKPAEPAPEHRD